MSSTGDPRVSSQEADREPSEAIPEYSAEQEWQDTKLWRTVVIGEKEHRIDMKCIEPYQRVISHGGYYGDWNAIIVFAACFLPDSNSDDYHYVLENLFRVDKRMNSGVWSFLGACYPFGHMSMWLRVDHTLPACTHLWWRGKAILPCMIPYYSATQGRGTARIQAVLNTTDNAWVFKGERTYFGK